MLIIKKKGDISDDAEALIWVVEVTFVSDKLGI